MPMTKEEFEALGPKQRGYAVYMLGCREDEPNVPDEKNPYPHYSAAWVEWNNGQHNGVLAAQDDDA